MTFGNSGSKINSSVKLIFFWGSGLFFGIVFILLYSELGFVVVVVVVFVFINGFVVDEYFVVNFFVPSLFFLLKDVNPLLSSIGFPLFEHVIQTLNTVFSIITFIRSSICFPHTSQKDTISI